MKKKTPKKSLFKYFEPIDMTDFINDEGKTGSIEDSFRYFAFTPNKDNLFLNRFSKDDLMTIINKVGMLDHLNKRGFDNIILDIEKDETLIHYLKIYYGEQKRNNILVDLRRSESRFLPDSKYFPEDIEAVTYDMIVIEWLASQNPHTDFSNNRPQLPGQKKPGLGILNFMMEMMYIVGREVIKDGFMDVPDHMHGAIMYSKKFKFFNPSHEAILQAIVRDLSNYPLIDISWGMLTNTIYDAETGNPQEYDPSEQIFPLSRRIRKYFNSKMYKERLRYVYKKKRYKFDYNRMLELKSEMLKNKSVVDF